MQLIIERRRHSLRRTWGTFFIETIDHFGLDDNDPNHTFEIKDVNIGIYQHLHSGFAAWWILQHKKSYTKFK